MTFKVRNISNWLGDQVCGLYALQAYKNAHPTITVEYYCKKFDWFRDVKNIIVKPFYDYSHGQGVNDSTFIADQKTILTRKDWHLLRLGISNTKPCTPLLNRSYSKKNNEIILFPFSSGYEKDWSMKNWILLEKKIIKLGFKTIIICDKNQTILLNEFKGVKHSNLSPHGIIDLILKSHCVIGTDNGVIHIAGMYDVPTISLLSASSHNYLYSYTNIGSIEKNKLDEMQIDSVIEKLLFSPIIKEKQNKKIFNAGGLGSSSNGGIYNTSIASLDDTQYLLSRVEERSEKERGIWDSSVPFLSKFTSSNTSETRKLNFYCRIEDFRLFNWKNSLYCGHPMVFFPSSKTVQVISEVDVKTNSLNVKFFPVLSDRVLNTIEKNWAFFVVKTKLFFVYSINPFRVYSFNDNSVCSPVIETTIKSDWNDNSMLSCSTNPIEFDEENYIMFFHQRQNGIYAQGILLFDKKTFAPTYISPEPFYKSSDNGGVNPHVCYFMGCFIEGENVLVTAGVGDSHTELFSWNKKFIKDTLVELPKTKFQKAELN